MFVSTLLHFLDICWGRFDLQHSSKQFINRIQCTCRSLSADCRGLVAAASPAIPKSDHRSTWLRLAGLEGTTAQTLPGFCRYSVQAVEALRLQLPRGLAAALLCLRQLRLHHAVLAKDRERATKAQAGWHLAHCASFARLTVAQISEPDFAAALSKSGASRRIPALAVVVQLERCIQSQGEEAETLLEVGRLRLMQAQASQQGAITDDEGGHEEPRRFVAAALAAWQRALVVDSRVLAARTPAGVADALQAATAASFAGGSHAILLLRDASDAAHLLEGMDLDHLAFRALVLCLACLYRRHGSAALWWRPEAMEVREKVPSCMQASVVLLYRMAGAMGRLASTPTADAEVRAAALDWWQLAEAAGSGIPDGQGSHIVALQRLIAVSTMPEQSPGIWGEGGAWIDVHASARAAVACVAREEGAVPQNWLHVVEALWALASCTMRWQDRRCQCPGGSAVTAQCAALTSLMLLFRGQSKARSLKVQQNAQDAAEEPWLRWPAFRSALLQLRVVSQASHLYKWLGEADLADACCQCGLQLISQRLCGDHRWKLRFLCMRARSAVAQSSRLPDMAGFKDVKAPELERLLAEIDTLWKGMQVSAKMGAEEGPEAAAPWECLELWAEAGTMAGSCWRGFPEFGRSWKLRLTALAAQRRRCPEAWAAHIDGLLSWMRTMPDQPLPQLGQMLLTVAQVFFDEAVDGGHNSIDAGTCDELLAVLSSCKRELVRGESCPLLQPHQEEAVATAAKDGSSSSAKLVAVFYLVAGAFRDALVAGDSLTLRSSAQLLLRAAEASKSKAAALQKDEKVPSRGNCRSRSRSPRRDMPGGVLSSSWTREYWSLCKQVVPLCSAVSLLFLTELRSMQRVVESLGDARMAQYFFSEPHKELQPSVAVAKLSSGEWLKEVRADLSLAWLQVDWQGPMLRITRSLDSGLGPDSHSQLVSQQVLLPHGLLPCLQEELRSLHALNGQKIRELWQRNDKGTEAVRREFWNSRKRFDAELGRVAEKVEQEILGPWRFLLAPWPQTDRAQQTLLAQLDAWIEEATSASHRTLRSAQDGQQPSLRPEDAQQRFLLALLFLEADKLEAGEIATVLEAFWPGNSSQLRRRASSLKRYRSDCRAVLGAAEISQEEAPLILYVDATVAQLPLEACACLRHRQVVRGLAPNMTLKALAGAGDVKPRTGYFIIDPAEDCSNMGDVRQLLARWSSHGQAWHGHTGQPMPASKEVLEELCCNDVFIYLGHGERARQLLRQDELQLAGSTKGASQASLASQATSEESSQESLFEPPGSEPAKRGLRSILMLLGCSSVRLQRPSAQGRRGDFESFGLASSALLGGAPLVLGAQWDVLGGDLDRLASRLLQDWLKGVTEEGQAGLLSSLRSLRPRCMLPNLTGAAV
ncbi:ESPL1, partial [Symbiodinium sp. KB8]